MAQIFYLADHNAVRGLSPSRRRAQRAKSPIEAIIRWRFIEAPEPGELELVGLCHPRGKCSLCEVAELIRSSVEHCCHLGVRRVLVNVTRLTGFSIPSLVDRFILAEELAKAAEHTVAVALVVREEYIHPQKFGVAVAAHLGLKLDVFSSETDALAWIASPT